MRRVLDTAEYQTLTRAESGPARRGHGVPASVVDQCIAQGLATKYERPGFFDSNEFQLTDEGRRALSDTRYR